MEKLRIYSFLGMMVAGSWLFMAMVLWMGGLDNAVKVVGGTGTILMSVSWVVFMITERFEIKTK